MFDWLSTKLDNLWKAFIEFFANIWKAFTEFVLDLPAQILELILNAISSLVSSIPVPSFLQNGASVLFANLDSSVLFFLNISGLFQGLAIFGSGVAFRLLRKIFTLGQW